MLIVTWQDAEELAAAHMRVLGFADARVTEPGPDSGVDVDATGGIAQVKHHAQPVGAPAVQQARGAARLSRWVLFYSLTGFTDRAVTAARACGVALFRYDIAGNVTPVDELAESLARGGARPMGGAPLRSPAWVAFTEVVGRYGQGVIDAFGRVSEAAASRIDAGEVPDDVEVILANAQRGAELLAKLGSSRDWHVPSLVEDINELDALTMDTATRVGLDPSVMYSAASTSHQ